MVTGQITGDTLPAQLLNVVAPVVAATSRERIRSFMVKKIACLSLRG